MDTRPALAQDAGTADVIVVGAGSAGATLAARLSEDPARRVLLIEAGRDTPPEAVPPDVADTFPRSYSNPDYMWPGLQATLRPGSQPRPYTQARIMGGGSSLMGMWALRGLAADYDAWRDAGAQGWGWRDVRPCFERLESDALHGERGGPVAIERVAPSEWPQYVQAAQRAAATLGYPARPDVNGSDEEGFFALPLSQDHGTRASSASAYLTPQARRRGNLRIVTDAEVKRVAFDGRRTTGVLAQRAGAALHFAAREVIVCGGAIHSPALLLRSGIGPAAELRALGVPVVADLPGVGRGLRNHVAVNIGLTLPAGSRQSPQVRNYGVACMRATSGLPPGTPADLLLAFIGRTSMRRLGTRVGILGVFLYDPLSVGAVTLERAGDDLRPSVAFNLLSAPEDCSRIAHGLRLALRILAAPECAGAWQEAFLLPPTAPLHRINRPGAMAALQALAGLAVFGAGAWTRRLALASVVGRNSFLDPRHADALAREQLEALARAAATPLFHVAGTCAMGPAGDPAAVVDPRCRVAAVQGLRVADCSIMPRLPRANTNLPAIMIGERAAELITSGHEALPRCALA